MPILPSGVAIQTRYMIEALLATGEFQVLSLGGAIKHKSYEPIQAAKEWKIYPIDGYGSREQLSSVIQGFQPDILWFMTDPRFYEWLWMMEDEIRGDIPMVYYHVWDNYPYPKFNKKFYESNDAVATISKVTSDIVQTVAPSVLEHYIPHAADPQSFKVIPEVNLMEFYRNNPSLINKKIFFWNNRNARRKQSGTLIHWWNDFINLKPEYKEDCMLIMHTDPADPNGQPLHYIAAELNLSSENFLLSTEKLPAQALALFYNAAYCTVNISDAEGFGLSTLESLNCGTPIITTMTGGLQEQVTDGEEWFGIGIEPSSKAVIGSQQVPYIYEDRVSREDFLNALETMYGMDPEEYRSMSTKGVEHVKKNYSFESYQNKWVHFLKHIHEHFGSYETRKNYKNWDKNTL